MQVGNLAACFMFIFPGLSLVLFVTDVAQQQQRDALPASKQTLDNSGASTMVFTILHSHDTSPKQRLQIISGLGLACFGVVIFWVGLITSLGTSLAIWH